MKTITNHCITLRRASLVACPAPPPAGACTGIRLTAKDGTTVYARTLELGGDLDSNIIVVPRGHAYVGDTPMGTPGLRWTTKYAFVGPNARGLPFVCDGMNEKGLAVGNFLFPGSAGYQKIDADQRRPGDRLLPGRRLSAEHVRHGEGRRGGARGRAGGLGGEPTPPPLAATALRGA